MDSLSVTIPAYNEEENIKNAIEEAYHFLKKLKRDFEIVVINDGSTDYNLQISGVFVKLHDADSTNKIINSYIDGFDDTDSTFIDTDPADYYAIPGENTLALSGDCTGYQRISIGLEVDITNLNALDINYVRVEYYYS